MSRGADWAAGALPQTPLATRALATLLAVPGRPLAPPQPQPALHGLLRRVRALLSRVACAHQLRTRTDPLDGPLEEVDERLLSRLAGNLREALPPLMRSAGDNPLSAWVKYTCEGRAYYKRDDPEEASLEPPSEGVKQVAEAGMP